jgi:hypothetical protein
MRAAVALTVLPIAVLAGVAPAYATPPPPRPWNDLTIGGTATAEDASVDLQCVETADDRYSCQVELRMQLVGGPAGAHVYIPDGRSERFAHPPELIVNGRQASGGVRIGASQRVTVEMRLTTESGTTRPLPPMLESRWNFPVEARHPVLGHGSQLALRPTSISALYLIATDVTFSGGVRIRANLPPSVYVLVDRQPVSAWPHEVASVGSIRVASRSGPPPVVHGGPALTLGGLMRTDGAPTRFLLGVGYELSFLEHFLVSAWLETDFESIQEALLLEVASPGLVVIPSVAAGVGVVSTQLGDRGVDAGLRLRASLHFFVVGLVADFDYFVLSGTWNVALAARLSI